MEEMIQDKVAQKANELHATYDERIRNYEERCVRLAAHNVNCPKHWLYLQGAGSSKASSPGKQPAQRLARIARYQSGQVN